MQPKEEVSLSDQLEVPIPAPKTASLFAGNSTSQDKLFRKQKKRKDVDAMFKRKVVPKKVSDNSEESAQEPLPPKAPEQNARITDFFTTQKWLKSKGTIPTSVPDTIEDPNHQKELKLLQMRLHEKEVSERHLEMQLKRVEAECKMDSDRNQLFRKKTQEAFAALLLKNEEYRRELAKIQIEKEKFRLGEFVSRRESVRFVEEWVDGYEIRQVKEAIRQKEGEKEDLERQKKDIKSRQQNGKKPLVEKNQQRLTFTLEPYEGSNSMVELDNTQRKERISFQLSILQKEELDLRGKLQRLEEERNMFIIRLKMYNDEISCRYARASADNNDRAWPLLADRYQLLSLLGKGGFSEVYKGFDLEDYQLAACKIHHLNSSWTEQCKSNYIKHALRENEIHKRLKHQNIVQLYDTIEINSESFCQGNSTVLEFCDGLDLNHHLKKYKLLTEKEAKIIIRQILSALNYLNSSGTKVIHYDLKPQNVLFHKGEVKISDFGLCKIIDTDQTRMELTSQGLGTYWYLPPECFIQTEQAPHISTKVDVWSVGVIMFEMVFGQRPFGQGMSQERIFKEQVILKSTQVVFPAKPVASNECKEFIKRCLTYNMEARWDVQDAYFCPYIQNQK